MVYLICPVGDLKFDAFLFPIAISGPIRYFPLPLDRLQEVADCQSPCFQHPIDIDRSLFQLCAIISVPRSYNYESKGWEAGWMPEQITAHRQILMLSHIFLPPLSSITRHSRLGNDECIKSLAGVPGAEIRNSFRLVCAAGLVTVARVGLSR